MKVEQEMSILQKFEAFMLLMIFLIPLTASNSQFCTPNIGVLDRINFFHNIANSGLAPAGEVCNFENLLLIYAIFALSGCYLLRRAIQKRIVVAQIRRNIQTPDIKPALKFTVRIFFFLTILLLVILFVPDSIELHHPDISFERKKLTFLMIGLCSDCMIFGLILALWRTEDDLDIGTDLSANQR
jgi:hypothetical protein